MDQQPLDSQAIIKLWENVALDDNIQRIDGLIRTHLPDSIEKMGFSLGIRLALGMAGEMKRGKPLGSETGALIASWIEKYGEAPVEEAIQNARRLLLHPDALKAALEERFFNKKSP